MIAKVGQHRPYYTVNHSSKFHHDMYMQICDVNHIKLQFWEDILMGTVVKYRTDWNEIWHKYKDL